MTEKKQGPKTKITPRKHKEPGFICDLCKVHIGTVQAYKNHIVQCLESRVYCETRGKAFAKLMYLNQHMSRFHSKNADDRSESKTAAISKVSWDGDSDNEERKLESLKSDSDENGDNDSDGSNLDKDPHIYLEEEQIDTNKNDLDSMDSEDSKNVNDIRVRRMFRKKTNPMPVWAPVKLKNESTLTITSEHGDTCASLLKTDTKVSSVNKTKETSELKSVDIKSSSSSVKDVENVEPNNFKSENVHKASMKDLVQENTEKKGYNNNDSGREVQKDTIGQNKGLNLDLDFCVKGGETLTQIISVSKDGEELFTLTSRNTGPRFGDMKCNLEDFFGPGKVNFQDVNIEVQAGSLKFKIIKSA